MLYKTVSTRLLLTCFFFLLLSYDKRLLIFDLCLSLFDTLLVKNTAAFYFYFCFFFFLVSASSTLIFLIVCIHFYRVCAILAFFITKNLSTNSIHNFVYWNNVDKNQKCYANPTNVLISSYDLLRRLF